LGNFFPEDAKQVIQNLTRQSQFNLEPSLLDELVRDLAGELGEVRPIELQVVGAQLQTEKIVTLKQYQEHGPKNAIVGRFLDEVVQDCGTDNEQIAKLILYLLTDENNTRPLKTRADLEMELEVQSERLDLVLEILVTSRLVFRIPAFPEDRYQLVHDYLVSFVRQQQSSQLIAELEKEREQRKLTEARLTQVLKRELQTARKATLTLGGLLLAIGGFALVATAVGINMYLTNLTLSSAEKTQLDRLMLAIKAGKRFNSLSVAALPETKLRVVAELNKAVYDAKELNRLEGHKSSITRVAFSLNNEMIASASEDGNIKIWNINGILIQDFEGHKSSITSLVFSPDSKILASASKDKTVKLWSVDGKLIKTLKAHQDTVTNIVFSSNGKILASASKDQTVKLWSIDYGKLLRTLKHEDEVTCLSFGSDNQMLVSASKDGLIKLWKVDGTELKSINNYGTVNLVLNSKNKTIISANKNATLKVYSLNGDLLKSGFIHANTTPSNILNVNFSLNHEMIVFNNFYAYDNDVKIQNIKSDETMEIPSQKEQINTAAINPNNQLLATAGEDKIIKIWDISSRFRHLNNRINNKLKLIFDKNNDIVTASEDGTVKLWNASGNLVKITHKYESTPQLISNLSIIGTVGVEKTLSSLIDIEGTKLRFSNNHVRALKIDFSPSNQIFTTINNNNTINIWHREGKLFKKINVYVDSAEKIFFSPDSRMIIVVCKDQLELRNIKGELITSLKEPSDSINNIIFSPDSKTFLSIDKNKLAKIWSINGTLLGFLKRDIEGKNNIAFLPNGKFITCTGNKQLVQFHEGKDNSSQDLIGNLIELWSNDGKLIKRLDGHIDGIKAITVSPDSKFLASTSSDNLIMLWNVNDNIVRTLKGHTEQIDSISFSPDSKIIASVSTGERPFFIEESGGQSEIKLWQTNGELIDTIYDYGINNEIKIKFELKNNMIAYVNNDKVINLRGLNNKSNILIKGHEERIKNIDFIPGTNLIISAGNDNIIKIWNLKGEQLKSFRASNNEELGTKSFHNSIEVYFDFALKFIASINTYYFKGKQRSKLNIWDISGSKLQDIEADEIHVNDDDSFITAIDRDTKSKKYTVKFWNGDTRKLENFYFEDANSFELSHDNKILALFSDKKYSMKLQDMDGNLVSLLKYHKDNINSIAFSPNGEIIASASDDKTIKLWTKEGHLIRNIDKQSAKINSVAFSPDGETIASASDDKTIKLWTKKGDFIKKVGKHNDKITRVSFSPDGRIIVSVSADGNVKLWDNNGKLWDNNSQPIKNIEDGVKEISDLSFSPDSQLLAMVKNSTIKIYILHGIWFKELQLINDSRLSSLSGLSFSPDGKTIASALEDYNKILVLNFDLNELLIHGCRKVRDYLQNNPNVKDRHLCDDVPKELPPAKEK
jgi:WD40 repeat protein